MGSYFEHSTLRPRIRNLLVAVAIILTAPLWIPAKIARAARRSDDIFVTAGQIISVIPGVVGIFLRRGFFAMTLESMAWDCSIGCGTWLTHPQIRIGSCVSIGGRCMIGMCEIGENTLLGSNIDVLSGRHQHAAVSTEFSRERERGNYSPIRIGRNAWSGNSAVVMADVGDSSVIGAGSVVVKPIPANSVAVGNPAVVTRSCLSPNDLSPVVSTKEGNSL